jgi:homoserine dehydrogenase
VGVLVTQAAYLQAKHDVTFSVAAISDLSGAIVAAPSKSLDLINLHYLVQNKLSIESLEGFSRGKKAEEAINESDADIMIELTPTVPSNGQPALSHILTAFNSGKHVITANKGPLVIKGGLRSLQEEAAKVGKMFKFGCATAAALPTTNIGYYDLPGSRITEIVGILNGTSNYILTSMYNHEASFETALAQAKGLGIAEHDSTLDINGTDTAIKLVILANALLDADCSLEDVAITGIQNLSLAAIQATASSNRAYKLMGSAKVNAPGDLILKVAPVAVAADDPFYGVVGTAKAVSFSSELMGTLFVSGGNSSLTGAAAAVLRDLINLSREEAR